MLNILDKLFHEYKNDDRVCEVWKDLEGTWITRHYRLNEMGRVWVKDVCHTGHNEHWVEDAAENWVLGVNS
tara:strand:- start:414 stop:626 length:213 start_codon:yes stop_codon:yes gene_type:complete